MTRRSPSFACLLVALLGLALIQQGQAVVGHFWWTVPSWDSPVTHEFEELVSVTPPHVDPTRQVTERAIPPRRVVARMLLPEGPPAPARIVLSGQITRSPPALPAA